MEDAPEGLPSEQHRLPMGVPSKGRMSTTVSAPQSTGYDEGEGNVPEAQENTRGRRIQGVGAERFVRRQLVKALISNDRLIPKADPPAVGFSRRSEVRNALSYGYAFPDVVPAPTSGTQLSRKCVYPDGTSNLLSRTGIGIILPCISVSVG